MFPFLPKTWHMPDGSKTATKPSDGQTWSRFDSSGAEIEKWQWEGTKDCWVNVSSGRPNKQNTATYVIPSQPRPIDLDNYGESGYMFGEYHSKVAHAIKKCECGSEHVGSPRHSSWCSKYDPRS